MKDVLVCTLFGCICGLANGYFSWDAALLAETSIIKHYLKEAAGLVAMGFVGGLTVIYVTR